MYIYIYIKYNSFLCKMSTNNKIIIIGGKKSSGKDTVADYITKKYNFKKMAIANKLKSIVKILFDFSDEQLNNEILKEKLDKNWKITPRQAMQFIGTDMFQFQIQKLCPNVGRNFWINSFINEMNIIVKHSNIVISDIRFKHEFDEIYKNFNKYNIISIKLSRNTKCKYDYHISETEIENMKFKYNIDNNSSKKKLYIEIDKILDQY